LTEVIVRTYLPRDRNSCRSLWRELTEWHRRIYDDPSIGGENPEDYFDKHLEKVGAAHLWVAFLDSKVVGLVGLVVVGDEAEIEPLIVNEFYRNKGVGRSLVERAVAEAHSLGARFLSVKSVARNTEAIRFFYNQDFRNMGQVEFFMDLSNHLWNKGPKFFDCQFDF
jgi:GNAT superfamily N-acetyltransferase